MQSFFHGLPHLRTKLDKHTPLSTLLSTSLIKAVALIDGFERGEAGKSENMRACARESEEFCFSPRKSSYTPFPLCL
jgi:hypothetical protein